MIHDRSIQGRALEFTALLENGVQYRPIPIHAICWDKCPVQPLHELELWDCFGDVIEVFRITALKSLTCAYFYKDKWTKGTYMMTFDWFGNGYSDEPTQHKTGHLIKLDNGNYALQPNNRIAWYDSAFVSPFTERPDYKVNSKVWSAESIVTGKHNFH